MPLGGGENIRKKGWKGGEGPDFQRQAGGQLTCWDVVCMCGVRADREPHSVKCAESLRRGSEQMLEV